MSDTAPESTKLQSVELTARPCCSRLFLVASLLLQVAALVCLIVFLVVPQPGSDPTPAPTQTVSPSPTASTTRSPSPSTAVPVPSPTVDPTQGGCNIFDAECTPSGTPGSSTGGDTA